MRAAPPLPAVLAAVLLVIIVPYSYQTHGWVQQRDPQLAASAPAAGDARAQRMSPAAPGDMQPLSQASRRRLLTVSSGSSGCISDSSSSNDGGGGGAGTGTALILKAGTSAAHRRRAQQSGLVPVSFSAVVQVSPPLSSSTDERMATVKESIANLTRAAAIFAVVGAKRVRTRMTVAQDGFVADCGDAAQAALRSRLGSYLGVSSADVTVACVRQAATSDTLVPQPPTCSSLGAVLVLDVSVRIALTASETEAQQQLYRLSAPESGGQVLEQQQLQGLCVPAVESMPLAASQLDFVVTMPDPTPAYLQPSPSPALADGAAGSGADPAVAAAAATVYMQQALRSDLALAVAIGLELPLSAVSVPVSSLVLQLPPSPPPAAVMPAVAASPPPPAPVVRTQAEGEVGDFHKDEDWQLPIIIALSAAAGLVVLIFALAIWRSRRAAAEQPRGPRNAKHRTGNTNVAVPYTDQDNVLGSLAPGTRPMGHKPEDAKRVSALGLDEHDVEVGLSHAPGGAQPKGPQQQQQPGGAMRLNEANGPLSHPLTPEVQGFFGRVLSFRRGRPPANAAASSPGSNAAGAAGAGAAADGSDRGGGGDAGGDGSGSMVRRARSVDAPPGSPAQQLAHAWPTLASSPDEGPASDQQQQQLFMERYAQTSKSMGGQAGAQELRKAALRRLHQDGAAGQAARASDAGAGAASHQQQQQQQRALLQRSDSGLARLLGFSSPGADASSGEGTAAAPRNTASGALTSPQQQATSRFATEGGYMQQQQQRGRPGSATEGGYGGGGDGRPNRLAGSSGGDAELLSQRSLRRVDSYQSVLVGADGQPVLVYEGRRPPRNTRLSDNGPLGGSRQGSAVDAALQSQRSSELGDPLARLHSRADLAIMNDCDDDLMVPEHEHEVLLEQAPRPLSNLLASAPSLRGNLTSPPSAAGAGGAAAAQQQHPRGASFSSLGSSSHHFAPHAAHAAAGSRLGRAVGRRASQVLSIDGYQQQQASARGAVQASASGGAATAPRGALTSGFGAAAGNGAGGGADTPRSSGKSVRWTRAMDMAFEMDPGVVLQGQERRHTTTNSDFPGAGSGSPPVGMLRSSTMGGPHAAAGGGGGWSAAVRRGAAEGPPAPDGLGRPGSATTRIGRQEGQLLHQASGNLHDSGAPNAAGGIGLPPPRRSVSGFGIGGALRSHSKVLQYLGAGNAAPPSREGPGGERHGQPAQPEQLQQQQRPYSSRWTSSVAAGAADGEQSRRYGTLRQQQQEGEEEGDSGSDHPGSPAWAAQRNAGSKAAALLAAFSAAPGAGPGRRTDDGRPMGILKTKSMSAATSRLLAGRGMSMSGAAPGGGEADGDAVLGRTWRRAVTRAAGDAEMHAAAAAALAAMAGEAQQQQQPGRMWRRTVTRAADDAHMHASAAAAMAAMAALEHPGASSAAAAGAAADGPGRVWRRSLSRAMLGGGISQPPPAAASPAAGHMDSLDQATGGRASATSSSVSELAGRLATPPPLPPVATMAPAGGGGVSREGGEQVLQLGRPRIASSQGMASAGTPLTTTTSRIARHVAPAAAGGGGDSPSTGSGPGKAPVAWRGTVNRLQREVSGTGAVGGNAHTGPQRQASWSTTAPGAGVRGVQRSATSVSSAGSAAAAAAAGSRARAAAAGPLLQRAGDGGKPSPLQRAGGGGSALQSPDGAMRTGSGSTLRVKTRAPLAGGSPTLGSPGSPGSGAWKMHGNALFKDEP